MYQWYDIFVSNIFIVLVNLLWIGGCSFSLFEVSIKMEKKTTKWKIQMLNVNANLKTGRRDYNNINTCVCEHVKGCIKI